MTRSFGQTQNPNVSLGWNLLQHVQASQVGWNILPRRFRLINWSPKSIFPSRNPLPLVNWPNIRQRWFVQWVCQSLEHWSQPMPMQCCSFLTIKVGGRYCHTFIRGRNPRSGIVVSVGCNSVLSNARKCHIFCTWYLFYCCMCHF